MRILVIGGTGFVGLHVVRRLVEAGNEVTIFHRGRTETELPVEVAHIHGDRRRLTDFTNDFRHVSPEVVLDAFAMREEDARASVAAFTGIARRLVAISSQDVYRAYGRIRRTESGPPDPMPLTERAPLRERLYPYREHNPFPPDDPRHAEAHDYDKIPVERTVMRTPGLSGTVLRLPMVHGPGDPQHRLFRYLKPMDDDRPAILLGEKLARWRAPRGYVENIAAAVALAVADERAAGRVYNVAEPDAMTELEWVRAVGHAAGWRGEVVLVPEDCLPAHLRFEGDLDQQWIVDDSRIRRELGYAENVPIEEWLQRAVAWERANPPERVDAAEFDYAAEDVALADVSRPSC